MKKIFKKICKFFEKYNKAERTCRKCGTCRHMCEIIKQNKKTKVK